MYPLLADTDDEHVQPPPLVSLVCHRSRRHITLLLRTIYRGNVCSPHNRHPCQIPKLSTEKVPSTCLQRHVYVICSTFTYQSWRSAKVMPLLPRDTSCSQARDTAMPDTTQKTCQPPSSDVIPDGLYVSSLFHGG